VAAQDDKTTTKIRSIVLDSAQRQTAREVQEQEKAIRDRFDDDDGRVHQGTANECTPSESHFVDPPNPGRFREGVAK
jgi:hypothetical protein